MWLGETVEFARARSMRSENLRSAERATIRTADQILAALPADVDAVYLTPYPALGEAQTARLIARLGARRLPPLSHTADDVPAGALASYEPPEHWLRRARRVAVDLQRILAGEDAGTLPVQLIGAPRLTLNLATARTIGFSPGYSIRTDAELVGPDSLGPADTVSLAMRCAAPPVANLDLKAANLEVESGAQDVRIARSDLLPTVESRFGGTVTREEVAASALGSSPSASRRRALVFGAALLGAGVGRLRLGAASAEGPPSSARADPARHRARRGPGVHQRAPGPHARRGAALEPVPQPLQPRDGAGPREPWEAPAAPTSTAGRARWPTRGGT